MSKISKDSAATSAEPHLEETCERSEQVYLGHFLDVRHDWVRLPDGTQAQREYIVHPGAVMVVPMLDDGRLVMERQFRYPLRRSFIEFPAGKLHPGEDPFVCGVRELEEETGYRASEWARAGVVNNAIAYSDEGIEIWFARGLVMGRQHLDEGEFLDVFAASEAELDEWVRTGVITDVKTIIGLMWLQHWRAGRWPLQWRESRR